MSAADPLTFLRPFLLNTLPAVAAPWVAGILGDHPSRYSRSPALWNAAFAALNLPATYVAFDVAPEQVDAFLVASRGAAGLLGFNVTVPYKERVLAHLDELDPEAAAIGAVNTIVRTPAGQLVGANTDGTAVWRALERLGGVAAGRGRFQSLLLLGAGGAARAVGVAVAREMAGTAILLCNRRPERAAETAGAIRRAGGEVTVVQPDDVALDLPEADIVLNATSVGMAGPIRTDHGITWLEPFSPLAPADPPSLAAPSGNGVSPPPEWWQRAWPEIGRNLEASLRRALRLHRAAAVLDLIYAPAETVLLKHARWTGHAAVNGVDVLVGQAVEAFLRICRPLLPQERSDVRASVTQAMTGAFRRTG